MKRTLLYLLLLPALLSGTCLLAAGPAGNAGHGAKPCLRRLTCEGLTDPLAIDTATPRFGWHAMLVARHCAHRKGQPESRLPRRPLRHRPDRPGIRLG